MFNGYQAPAGIAAPSKIARKQKFVLLGVPTYREMHAFTARFLIDIVIHSLSKREDIKFYVHFTDQMPVSQCKHCHEDGKDAKDARNLFAEKALELGCTHLFMIDSDMDRGTGMSNDVLARMLDQEKDIIAPLFIRRSHPFDLLAFHYSQQHNGHISITPQEAASQKILEVDAVGFGAVLINTRVLKAMKPPYFAFEMINGVWTAEDINFCRKARRNGFRVWCDTSQLLDHIGLHRYRPEDGVAVAEVVEQVRKDRANGAD